MGYVIDSENDKVLTVDEFIEETRDMDRSSIYENILRLVEQEKIRAWLCQDGVIRYKFNK